MPNTGAEGVSGDALQVAVGVVRDAADRVLIAQRAPARHQGGYWEFPGGKIEPNETAESALTRELAEELGITVQATRPLICVPHDYGDRRVYLNVLEVLDYTGMPAGLEEQPLRWVTTDALDPAAFPAANRAIISALQLPLHYVISPDCTDPSAWLAGLQAALQRGERLIQFRVRALAGSDRSALAAEALRRCHAHGARLLINGDAALAHTIGAEGVHWTAAQLQQLSRQDVLAAGVSGGSCHSPAELALAESLGVDFAVLSPVAATRSHPEATPLGWGQFTQWVSETALPVYALGGMRPDDWDQARAAGAQGVAGISGFWV
ncbi:MAG: Nudix family hydrolase [Spiribacter sp.]|nr:Nudix family hydrolase [Spiribacter sp.]MDR9454717.1 Nudix family hydrolase [Spiribacter sp.]